MYDNLDKLIPFDTQKNNDHQNPSSLVFSQEKKNAKCAHILSKNTQCVRVLTIGKKKSQSRGVEEEIGKRSDESIQRHGNWSGSSMEIQTVKDVERDECSGNIDYKGMLSLLCVCFFFNFRYVTTRRRSYVFFLNTGGCKEDQYSGH